MQRLLLALALATGCGARALDGETASPDAANAVDLASCFVCPSAPPANMSLCCNFTMPPVVCSYPSEDCHYVCRCGGSQSDTLTAAVAWVCTCQDE